MRYLNITYNIFLNSIIQKFQIMRMYCHISIDIYNRIVLIVTANVATSMVQIVSEGTLSFSSGRIEIVTQVDEGRQ